MNYNEKEDEIKETDSHCLECLQPIITNGSTTSTTIYLCSNNCREQWNKRKAKSTGFTIENKAKGLCINCNATFSNDNTFTESGWRETKISGLCEICFDRITFAFEEDLEYDNDPFK